MEASMCVCVCVEGVQFFMQLHAGPVCAVRIPTFIPRNNYDRFIQTPPQADRRWARQAVSLGTVGTLGHFQQLISVLLGPTSKRNTHL